jgi:hypothetical protein
MKPWRFYVAVAVTWILTDVVDYFARLGRSFLALVARIFETPARNSSCSVSRVPFTKRRILYLARLSKVELTAARDLGTSAKELLREGHPEIARRAARRAYLHWRKARKVFVRLSAVA